MDDMTRANAAQSPDAVAVEIMLHPKLSQEEKQRRLTALAVEVKIAVNGGRCPECGSTAPKEDNGLKPTDFDYGLLCPECGESWCPNV
jgi:predicted RNA-binding Zn-ribbon protein involved in translation (DUF1610 family)